MKKTAITFLAASLSAGVWHAFASPVPETSPLPASAPLPYVRPNTPAPFAAPNPDIITGAIPRTS
jgi:hypothetical protein